MAVVPLPKRQLFQLRGVRIFVKSEKVLSSREKLYVFDLDSTKLITDFTLKEPDKNIYGDLYVRGFMPVDDFRKVLIIDEGGIRAYQL